MTGKYKLNIVIRECLKEFTINHDYDDPLVILDAAQSQVNTYFTRVNNVIKELQKRGRIEPVSVKGRNVDMNIGEITGVSYNSRHNSNFAGTLLIHHNIVDVKATSFERYTDFINDSDNTKNSVYFVLSQEQLEFFVKHIYLDWQNKSEDDLSAIILRIMLMEEHNV